MKRWVIICFLLALVSFKNKELKWVAIGDSITYLNDHQDETANRITKGYMTLVTEKEKHISYINKGYNGWTSGQVAAKFESLNIQKADIYTIFLGTNDWWTGRPVGSFSDYLNNTGNTTINGSFRIIIDHLKTLNKHAKIVLITPMKRTDFVYINNMKNNAWGSYKEKSNQTLKQVADAILQIGAHEKINVIDLYSEPKLDYKRLVKFKRLRDGKTKRYKDFQYPDYINIPFDPEKDDYPYPVSAVNMTYDGLHPSDNGYRLIAKRVMKVFAKF